MTKKSFNQNIKFEKDLASTFEPDFTYNNRPINRFDTSKKDNTQNTKTYDMGHGQKLTVDISKPTHSHSNGIVKTTSNY